MATEIITQPTLINLTPDLMCRFNTRTPITSTKIGIIPNLLFRLKLEEWRKRDLQRERDIEIKKQKVDELSWAVCTDFEKAAIKRWIEKDKGYFNLETYKKYVQTLDKFERELNGIWESSEIEGDPSVFWTKKDGDKRLFIECKKAGTRKYKKTHSFDHYVEPQKIHDRNYKIGETRNKYLSGTKRGLSSYEMHANYYYASDEDKTAFLREVEEKGLLKKFENKLSDTFVKNIKELVEFDLVRGINTERCRHR